MDDDESLRQLLQLGRSERAPEGYLLRLELTAERACQKKEHTGWRSFAFIGGSLGLAAAAALTLHFVLNSPVQAMARHFELRADDALTTDEEKSALAPVLVPAVPAAPVQPTQKAQRNAEDRALTLSAEISLLADVRKALRAGDSSRALTMLDRSQRQLALGQLRLEAEVLRLEALAKLGKFEQASARAKRFVENNPNSPLVDRARTFVREPSSGLK
jgi:hypothetical protein